MGTFISRIKRDNVEVPQEKRKELGEKLYRLMTMGGCIIRPLCTRNPRSGYRESNKAVPSIRYCSTAS